MSRLVFAIPGDLASHSGGYEYDRRVLAALPGFGVEALHCPLPGSFPHPNAADIAVSVDAIARARRLGDAVLVDGLAYGALPGEALRMIAAPRIALVHHPLGFEMGLTPEQAAALRETEQHALSLAQCVIVTSPHTAKALAQEFGVPSGKITVAPPGVDPAPRAKGSANATRLIAIGSIIPRKAFDVLVAALAGLTDLDWTLSIVGADRHAPETAAALDRQIVEAGVAKRIARFRNLDAEGVACALNDADIFVSSSLYEGYGMALAEALARGLPIVTTTGGAAADTVADAAALKVPPGDAPALRDALRRAIGDAALRARLGEAAWRAGQNLPRWTDTARIVASVVLEIARDPQ